MTYNEKQIEQLFENLGFERILIKEDTVFNAEKLYCKLTFIETLRSYVIEYADSYEDAKNGLYEDGDLYAISLDFNDLLLAMRKEIVANMQNN